MYPTPRVSFCPRSTTTRQSTTWWSPVQGYGWHVVFKEYQIYFLVFVLVIFVVVATTCTMYPGRRLGPQRGERQQQGGASSSSRPTGGDGNQGGEDPARRSRTTSRDRSRPEEDIVATLHRRLALMFATVLEGAYTPRETYSHAIWNKADAQASVGCCSEP